MQFAGKIELLAVKIHCCVNMLPALHFMSCVSAALFTKTDPLLHRLTPAISQHGSWHPLREKRLLQLVVLQYALVKRYPIYRGGVRCGVVVRLRVGGGGGLDG